MESDGGADGAGSGGAWGFGGIEAGHEGGGALRASYVRGLRQEYRRAATGRQRRRFPLDVFRVNLDFGDGWLSRRSTLV